MKQELPTCDNKASVFSHSPATVTRSRVSRTKDSQRTESANGASPGLKARPKPVPREPDSTHRARRSILRNKLKPGSDDVGALKEREMEDSKITGLTGNRAIEQYARLRRCPDTCCKGSENGTDGKTEDLQRRREAGERLVKDLQSEVYALKAQLEKLQSLNVELESQNKQLLRSLFAAEAKITTLERRDQADERAVLKHFNWPERKADALREATFEYRDLKRLEHEFSSIEDDTSLLCEASLKKIESLLDKSERSIHRLIKLRGASMLSFRECKIPTDWMIDSGSKIKLASVKLAKVFMKRLSMELELLRHSEREPLLFQGV